MAGIGANGEDAHTFAVRDHRCPFSVAGGRERRLGQLEVRGPIIVNDQQPITRGLDVVFDTLASWRDDSRFTFGIIGAEEAKLRCDLASRSDDDPLIISAAVDAEPEALI